MELFVSQDTFGLEAGLAHPFVARLRERGHRVLSTPEQLARRSRTTTDPLDAALLPADGLLGSESRVRCWTAVMDEHPMGHPQLLASLQSGSLVTVPCRTHLNYLDKFASGLWKAFLPAGATLPPHDAPDGRDRRFAVVMHSTPDLADPDRFDHWIKPFQERGSEVADLFWLALGRLQNDPARSVVDEVDAGLQRINAHGLAEQPHDAFAALLEGMRLLERRRRATIQTRLLDAFRAAGVVVDLFGPHWAEHRASEGHRVHGPVSPGQMAALLRETQLFVQAGGFSDGPTEIPLTAMAAGATVVLDDTPWFAEHLGDAAAPYAAGFPAEAVDAVLTLRDQPTLRQDLARAGEKAVLAGHLWWHRADLWLGLIEKALAH